MKRIFTRWLLMTVLLIAGLTTAVAQQSVLNENFANGTLPQGWAKAGNDWDFSKSNAEFAPLKENAKDTLYTPVVSLSALKNEPTVTFSYSLEAVGSNVNILTLLFRAGGQGAWMALDTFDVATDGKTSFVQALPAMASIQLAIAADYKAGGSTYVYQLRVANKKEATVAPANFKAENLQANGVKLTWDASESDYFEKNNLKLSTSPLTNPDAEMGDVKNFMDESGLENEWCELSDLEPNTKYYAYVQYNCGYGDVSPWSELEFKTPCVAVSAPFSEGFEDGLPDCFAVWKQGSATTAEVNGEYPYNSTRSFKVNIEGTSGFYNYLILPELEDAVKKYQISFMAASEHSGNTYARRVAVGVCTDANDVATSFTEITTLNLPKGRTWENVVVSLKGYTGDGKYIVLKIGHPSMKTNLYIDDIKVEAASECPKPMFIQASNISTNAATIGWTKTGNENEWNLVVSTKPLANPEDIDPKESRGEYAGSVSTNPYTLSALKPNTTYYVYVQAACGSSEWTEAISFKTHREVSYPYAEHFDRLDPDLYTNNTASIPDSWVFDDRGNNPSYANYYDKQNTSDSYRPYVTTAQNHEATAYVKASLLMRGTSVSSSTSTGYTSIAMLPAMPKAVNTMMVTFWAYASSAQTVKIGVANTQTNELEQGKQLGENITEVGEAAISGGSEWKQYKVLLTSYAGTGRYITFYLKPGTSTPNVYIDDIVVDEAPDCNAVSTVSAEATGIDKATATWTDASSSTSWTIKVSSTEIDPASADGDIVASKTVNAKSYNITGLSMGGTYYIYVSPSCGDAWKSTTVTTLVGLQVPYYNDFTGESTGSNASRGPKNWTLGSTGSAYTSLGTQTYVPYLNTSAWTNKPVDETTPYLYLYNGTTASQQFPYAIMPELLNGNVKDMKIAFYAYWNNAKPSSPANYACVNDKYYGVLKIGVVSSPADINTSNKFTKVTQVAAVRCKEPKAAEYFVVDMSKYTGSGKYIVFYQDTAKNNYMAIDNLYVGPKSDPVPATPIVNLKYASLTTTGATLTWTEQGEATKWNVRVFTEAQEDPDAGEPAFSTTVNNTPTATITGLTHSTQYYAYVQSSQSNGNGAWVSTMFWTDCEKAPLPFTADFNSFEHGSTSLNTLSWCYMVGDKYGGQPGSTYTGTTPYYYNYVKNGQATTSSTTATGPGTSYYYVDHTYGNDPTTNIFYMYAGKDKLAYLVLPELDGDLATMTMRFYGCYSTAFTAGGSSGGAVEVCIYNESDGSFTHVENFKLSKAKEWEEFNVNFPSDIHSGRIAFRINNTADWRSSIGSTYSSGATFYMYLDDIKVQLIPQCQKILTVEAANVDSTSATISWAASEASKWNLKVSTTSLADPDAATADIFDGVIEGTPSKALSNLPDNTKLYVYAQTVRPEKSCVGEWSTEMSFKTLCRKLAFPYVEDFQSYTTTGAGNLPDCSTLSGQDADHSYLGTKGTGNIALNLRQVTKGHNNYFAFPALSIDSVKRLQLSMQVYTGATTATNTYQMEVGIMTDPNDPSTFVATHHEALAGASTPYDRVYTFEGYAGDETGTKFGTYIALKALEYKNSSNVEYAGSMYIDNVTIDFIETCAKPTDLQTDSIGTYGAKFIWNTDNKAAAHRVRIFKSADADPDNDAFAAEIVVNDSVATIEGLISLTTYYAYVRKECGGADGNSKWSSAFMFKTECGEYQSLPYEEGFEAYEANAIPDCWTPLDNTTNGKSRVGGTSSYAISGSRYLNVNYGSVGSSSGNTYYKSSIVTPKFDVTSVAELLLCLDARTGSGTGSLKIEAVSDNTTNAQAIVLTTITGITTTPKKIYLKLADYYSSAQPYQYLRFSPETQGVSIYVDNMIFTKDLNLVLPVENLKAQAITENSIKFTFTEPTPGVDQWQVAYVAAGGDLADATIKPMEATEYTIEGLAANTSYDIYVRGNVDGDTWTGPLTVSTIQTPAPLPLESGFDDDADQWMIYSVKTVQGGFYPNYFIVGAADSCDATGSKALFITNDSSSYEYQTKDDAGEIGFSNAWATRNINIANAGSYVFKFKIKVPANKENESDYATAHLFPAGATILAGNATMLNGTTRAGTAVTDVPASNIYSLMGKTFHQDEWIWVTKNVDVEEAGIYTLALFWYNASVGAQYGQALAVDSVIVEEYLCTTPKNVEFVERKANAVTLKWFAGQCKNFEYVISRYAKLGMPNLIDEEDKVAYGTLSNGPELTISDLMPNTNYSFYVRTICPDGETDWVEFDFDTPCKLVTLPYTESFTEDPGCWILTNATIGTTQVGTSASNEKWNRLLLNATSGMAILPELDADLNKVMVEIGLFNTTTQYGAVSLGVMDNMWDTESFKEVLACQTLTKPGSTGTYTPTQLEVFSKPLNLYTGSGKVLAIKNTTSNNIGIKYVKLTKLPDCMTPYQVEITYPTETAATVNWIAGTEEKWEIKVNNGEPFEVTEQPYRLTGLEQGTNYEVSVRAICDETHQSEWSQPAKFQTSCGVYSLPMIEDFSGLEQPKTTTDLKKADLTCWDNYVSTYNIDIVVKGNDAPFKPAANTYAANLWVSNWINALGTYDQLHSYHNTSSPAYRYKWFISPQYAIDGEATLSFDIRRCGNQGQPVPESSDRTFVAISTDNGATWKAADTIQLTGLTNKYYDKEVEDTLSGYTSRTISLKKYVGKNIRVAFYDENVSSQTISNNPFILIDNVRMNCSETNPIVDNACQGTDYKKYGFSIKEEDLPALGKDSTYTRFVQNLNNGCDTVYTLTLTTRPVEEGQILYDTICRGDGYQFGTRFITEPSPEDDPYFITARNEYGCYVYTWLHLAVLESDTTIMEPVEITNDMLPYELDKYYTIPAADSIPADKNMRVDTILVKQGNTCSFNKYFVTMNRCERHQLLSDTICESDTVYMKYNFNITKENLPAANSSPKRYDDTIRTAQGCDSVVSLKLFVFANDTMKIDTAVYNNELNLADYPVDEYFSIKQGTPVGEYDSLLSLGNCYYRLYKYEVKQCTRTSYYEVEICETETSYSGYGFEISKNDSLIAANSIKEYKKHVMIADGCDSLVTLKLTVNALEQADSVKATIYSDEPYMVGNDTIVPIGSDTGVYVKNLNIGDCKYTKYIITVKQCIRESEVINDTICELADGYYANGFEIAKADMPAASSSGDFKRHVTTSEGCDSVITLVLKVNALEQADSVKATIFSDELPYMAGNDVIVPIGSDTGVYVKNLNIGNCQYTKYIITVKQCIRESEVIYDTICETETSYSGYGFKIVKDSLPAASSSGDFKRHVTTSEGCDSIITLVLKVNALEQADSVKATIFSDELPYMAGNDVIVPIGSDTGVYVKNLNIGNCQYTKYIITVKQCIRESEVINDTICELADGYYANGFEIANAEFPAVNFTKKFERHETTFEGCDSIITLKLVVNKADTLLIEDEILNNALPYMVGNMEIIPANAPLGEQPAVVLQTGDCKFAKYVITVNQCKKESEVINVSICENAESYEGNGFSIAKADFPAVNLTKKFERHELTAEGCDSLITLMLTLKNDTAKIPVSVLITDLPYKVDDYYTVPDDAPVGEEFIVTKQIGDEGCLYNRYIVKVSACGSQQMYWDSICQNTSSYEGYGFQIAANEYPAPGETKQYYRDEADNEGCIHVTLNLTVNMADTAQISEAIFNNELPYMVGNDVIIPAGAALGVQPAVVIEAGDCKYTKYIITVNQCTKPSELITDNICEHADGYYANGFEIAKADMPAANSFKIFTRHELTAEGCDSVINLMLTVNKADTALITDEILNNELPYMVGNEEIIPAGAALGVQPAVVIETGDCKYAKYVITVIQCTKKSATLEASVCVNAEGYEGNGFSIAKADFPAVNFTKKFERHELTAEGCDSLITLNLTVNKADTALITDEILNNELPYMVGNEEIIPAGAALGVQPAVVIETGDCKYAKYVITVIQCTKKSATLEASVCVNAEGYEGNGFSIAKADFPAVNFTKKFERHELTAEGCDSLITLNLTVNKADTALITDEILNNELPYMVGNEEIIPAGAALGVQPAVVIETGDCKYAKYVITVIQCTKQSEMITDEICEFADSYNANGFEIAKADFPAANSFKRFERHELSAEGCDSIINLRLAVNKADTNIIPVMIENTQLPYIVDELYTVPADAAIGTAFNQIVKLDGCACNSYEVFIKRCVQEYAYTANICASATAYEGYGFSIPATDLPAVGQSKDYTRDGIHITSTCDSLITLTISVMKNDTTSYEDAICETQTAYQGHGFMLSSADLPAIGQSAIFYRSETSAQGCDSIIALSLAVVPNDTTVKTVNIDNTRLPYEVDPYYTVPADAVIGETFEKIIRLDEDECSYRKYIVTVTQCSRSFSYSETLCEGQQTFEGFGFAIEAADMPAIGTSKDFFRSNMSLQGCDSLITLTLIMKAADTTSIDVKIDNTQLPYYVDPYYTVPEDALVGQPFETIVKVSETGCTYNRYVVSITQVECSNEFSYADSICALAESYEGFGFAIAADKLPAAGQSIDYTRTAKDVKGCDSIITLTLKAYKPDTLYIVDSIAVNALPYVANGQIIVPAGAAAGEQPAVTFNSGDCAYVTYLITVLTCEIYADLTDEACVGSDYNEYGFAIKAADMPAAGQSKEFTRTNKSEAGCDSIITLTLSVKGDTIYLDPIEIGEEQLPYKINDYITIPVGTKPGVYADVIKLTDDCQFISYSLTIHEEGFGIIYVTDAVDYIEVYDILGHKITTIRQNEESQSLPTGVYMLRTIMKSGQIVNSKAALK